MLSPQEQGWFLSTFAAATKAGHIFAPIAACEAALKSSWGQSVLAVKALNLFGMKQCVHPIYGTLNLPTREFLDHTWVTVEAHLVEFPDLATCFTDRMATLTRLAPHYPHYAAALSAKTPRGGVAVLVHRSATGRQGVVDLPRTLGQLGTTNSIASQRFTGLGDGVPVNPLVVLDCVGDQADDLVHSPIGRPAQHAKPCNNLARGEKQ